jgi:hypothetical protein
MTNQILHLPFSQTCPSNNSFVNHHQYLQEIPTQFNSLIQQAHNITIITQSLILSCCSSVHRALTTQQQAPRAQFTITSASPPRPAVATSPHGEEKNKKNRKELEKEKDREDEMMA